MSEDTPLTPEQISSLEAQVSKEGLMHQDLVELDDLGNVVLSPLFLFERGTPGETISAHVRRIADDPEAKHKFIADVVNHFLNVIQPNHGAQAEVGDLVRALDVVQTERKALGLPIIDLLK